MNHIRVMTNALFEWGVRAFGFRHMQDEKVRALRFAEEAIELVQVVGLEKDHLHKLIDVVYSRPHGDIPQEMGGVMVTLAVLGRALGGIEIDAAMEREMLRVLGKPPEHFAERNKEKMRLGLTGHV